MKRLKLITLSFAITIFLSSCSSINVGEVKKLENVAVASIYTNKNIESDNLIGAIQSLSDDENFNLTPICNKLRDKTFNEFEKALPYSLMDEDKVIKNEKYHDYDQYSDKSTIGLKSFIVPENYELIIDRDLNQARTIELLKHLPDEADGVMIVGLDFRIEDQIGAMGMTSSKIRARVELTLYNADAEQIMKIRKGALSDGSFATTMGAVPDADKLLVYCEEAADKCYVEMEEYLAKKLN